MFAGEDTSCRAAFTTFDCASASDSASDARDSSAREPGEEWSDTRDSSARDRRNPAREPGEREPGDGPVGMLPGDDGTKRMDRLRPMVWCHGHRRPAVVHEKRRIGAGLFTIADKHGAAVGVASVQTNRPGLFTLLFALAADDIQVRREGLEIGTHHGPRVEVQCRRQRARRRRDAHAELYDACAMRGTRYSSARVTRKDVISLASVNK